MAAQVVLLAAGWRAIGRSHWPPGERWTWLRSFAHGWAARYVPGPPTGPAGKYLALRDAGMTVPAAAALLWVDQVLSLAAGSRCRRRWRCRPSALGGCGRRRRQPPARWRSPGRGPGRGWCGG
ncbi:hypothetical protein [Tepidiforma flava]|uniref:hypothetical protein n=1 Tax=Tepidiforma flava TaxID=3004094 RepID=UPI0035712B7B